VVRYLPVSAVRTTSPARWCFSHRPRRCMFMGACWPSMAAGWAG